MKDLLARLAEAGSAAEADRMIAEKLRHETGAMLVSVGRYDARAGRLRISHVSGNPDMLDDIRGILGQLPPNLDLRPGASLETMISGPEAVEFLDLRQAFFGQVPEAIVSELERALEIGRAYGLAFRRGRELLGVSLVQMHRGGALDMATLADYARRISAALKS